MEIQPITWVIPVAGLAAVLFAIYLARDVLSRDTGTAAMQDVAGTILEGAVAFIRRQYVTILALAVVGALIAGGYTGYAVAQLGGASELAETRLWHSALAALAGLGVMVAALWLEHACRVPDGEK